jgi:hypothetical protein
MSGRAMAVEKKHATWDAENTSNQDILQLNAWSVGESRRFPDEKFLRHAA